MPRLRRAHHGALIAGELRSRMAVRATDVIRLEERLSASGIGRPRIDHSRRRRQAAEPIREGLDSIRVFVRATHPVHEYQLDERVEIGNIAVPMEGLRALEPHVERLRSAIAEGLEFPDTAVFCPLGVARRARDAGTRVAMKDFVSGVE